MSLVWLRQSHGHSDVRTVGRLSIPANNFSVDPLFRYYRQTRLVRTNTPGVEIVRRRAVAIAGVAIVLAGWLGAHAGV